MTMWSRSFNSLNAAFTRRCSPKRSTKSRLSSPSGVIEMTSFIRISCSPSRSTNTLVSHTLFHLHNGILSPDNLFAHGGTTEGRFYQPDGLFHQVGQGKVARPHQVDMRLAHRQQYLLRPRER